MPTFLVQYPGLCLRWVKLMKWTALMLGGQETFLLTEDLSVLYSEGRHRDMLRTFYVAGTLFVLTPCYYVAYLRRHRGKKTGPPSGGGAKSSKGFAGAEVASRVAVPQRARPDAVGALACGAPWV